MAFAMTTSGDRRGAVRLGPEELPDGVRGRIRPGHQVRVLNLSPCGVLIDTNQRLLPGTTLELHLEAGAERHATRARVARCQVVTVLAAALVYRAGLELERPISWAVRARTDVAGTSPAPPPHWRLSPVAD
jgi:hypothetical protein